MTSPIQIPPYLMGLISGLSQLDVVEAITISGAQMSVPITPDTTINMDIYARNADVPLGAREDFVRAHADQYEMGIYGRPTCDEWRDRDTHSHIRLRYRDVVWVIDEIQNVMTYHRAQLGESTTVLHHVKDAIPVYDRGNWFSELQKTALQPYPEALAANIILLNYRKLRDSLSSYTHQLETAQRYNDAVQINHVATLFVSSYLDVLFALNRLPNPNAPRMLDLVERVCRIKPPNIREQIEALLISTEPLPIAQQMVEDLSQLLINNRQHPDQLGG